MSDDSRSVRVLASVSTQDPILMNLLVLGIASEDLSSFGSLKSLTLNLQSL